MCARGDEWLLVVEGLDGVKVKSAAVIEALIDLN